MLNGTDRHASKLERTKCTVKIRLSVRKCKNLTLVPIINGKLIRGNGNIVFERP